jgi:hypothetical protein
LLTLLFFCSYNFERVILYIYGSWKPAAEVSYKFSIWRIGVLEDSQLKKIKKVLGDVLFCPFNNKKEFLYLL